MKRNKKDEASIEQMIYDETEKRLVAMADESYEFPPKATAADYIAIGALVGVCILLVVLCAVGVIV